MSLCVIPARGGSKRVPRKNIREFCNKPMIFYAINAAQQSGLFTRVIVSTEDFEIAQIARNLGAEVPFMRPRELADDTTPTVPVIADAISRLTSVGQLPKYTCCIYPCVPFLRIEDLKLALSILEKVDASFSFPITEYPSAIQRALRLDHVGNLSPFYPEFERFRSQDLEPAYFDAGQFYWAKTSTWLESDVSIHSNSVGLPVPYWRIVDIDTLDDWKRAELLMLYLMSETQSK